MTVQICPKCNGKGIILRKIKQYTGNCINGQRCLFTSQSGNRVTNCIFCGRHIKGKSSQNNHIQKSKEDKWLCKCGKYHKGFPYKCKNNQSGDAVGTIAFPKSSSPKQRLK